MISLNVLQYNTDNLRHGWEYFDRNAEGKDLFLLQRFPESKYKELCNVVEGRFYIENSVPGCGDLSISIGRKRDSCTLQGMDAVLLPNKQHCCAVEDYWQGTVAMKTTIVGGVGLINVLPCFADESGEFPIHKSQTLQDIEFVLQQCEDKPHIIVGDFHLSPADEELSKLLEKYNFRSLLDNIDTFYSTTNEDPFNLDRFITNSDVVSISDISVDYGIENKNGHLAISYNLDIGKDNE